ncbi:NAD(P)H-dependent oxidoreductase [Fulvivirgaceae bacterium BMA10]|uniref:FMN dependent NADH:quinone oxidoreductase n=1 Tax=Splendidivirga corallicola TaxID=3051826 RepID=A0ABT8KVJ4_9BACT|nr:NAD(P)H-dependent oxidoreductase [Fulvivirgaceae bacterium BMA10]
MKTLLRIDSSSRIEGSHSRKLADYVEAKWRAFHPDGHVVYRDLVKHHIPHIPNNTIEGFYTPKEKITDLVLKATAISDELIAELKQADELLISSPLYNLNIPSNLKAYIDHVTRIGHTFGMNSDGSYFGLLNGKTAYLATVKGGKYAGTPMAAYDFQEPYLKAILHHMGITVKSIFSLEGTAQAGSMEQNLFQVHQQIDTIFNL